MLKVELINFDDLTEDEKEIVPNNGRGKEFANYIKISDNGKLIALLSDAVEPEDATFRRDFNFVSTFEAVYKIGIEHGKN